MVDAAGPTPRDNKGMAGPTELTNTSPFEEADHIIAGLSAGKRESVREVVINAMNLGALSDSAHRYLERTTGSRAVGDLLVICLAEMRNQRTGADSETPADAQQ